MRKFLAVIMVLAMTMSLTTVAFAGDPEPIPGPEPAPQVVVPEIVGETAKTVGFHLVYTPGETLYQDYVEVEVSWNSNTSGSYEFTKGARNFVWNTEEFKYEEEGEAEPDAGEFTGLPALGVTVTNYSSPGYDFIAYLEVLDDDFSPLWSDESGVATPALQAANFIDMLLSGIGLGSMTDRTVNWNFDFSGLDNEKVMAKISELLEEDPDLVACDFGFSANVVLEPILDIDIEP